MRVSQLHEWIISVATDTLRDSNVVSVSTPSEHADIANAHDGAVYPFVGVVPISLTTIENGLGNETLTPTAVTENGDDVSVEEVLRRDFTIEVTPVTDDDAYIRDELVDELTLMFAQRVANNDDPDDVRRLSVGETTPSDRADSFVRGSGVTLSGRLYTASERAVPRVTDVQIDINYSSDETLTNIYPEQFSQ